MNSEAGGRLRHADNRLSGIADFPFQEQEAKMAGEDRPREGYTFSHTFPHLILGGT